uniref:Ig-like domain-containing protein n=1 Tax=Cynoglossus semilaevis TaxID=244447 RepID=A0A3P8VYA1_CYNSE
MPASLPDSLRLSLLHPHSASGLTHRTISSPDSQPGSVRSQSNMFPAWRRRGMRTEGAAVAPPRTVIIAGQVGQVWVSCWILLSATCILSAWAQVDDVPPYFKMEPPQTQVHLEGNRLVLTCMAEGSWPLEFKWIYNGTELTRFSLEYRYLIPTLDRSHAGSYRCIVRNRVGAIMQCSTMVQVAYMGGFVEGERFQTVSQGEAGLIRVSQIHSFPKPQITWFRDGRKIPSSSRIAITLDNTLVILSSVAPDAGRYYAQAVNDKNGENKTSLPITLIVDSKYKKTTRTPVHVLLCSNSFQCKVDQ